MMWSVSIAYRLGLGFHALNNEGSDGSNLMQPRRIDVGKTTYDGISGEMVRRHILENFVRICESRDIPLLTASRALHPDRGPLGLREVAKKNLDAATLTDENLFQAVRTATQKCALLDVGGYLAAFSEKEKGQGIPESGFLASIAAQSKPTTVKRDSVFDVGWMISEAPQEMTITQHAAYRPTGDQSMFSQTMRTNVYGGVIRADLHRIGTDDYWYLATDNARLAIESDAQLTRQEALVSAFVDYLISPSGAKTAGWAPHVFKTEGVILLSSARTAPFVSPITVDLSVAGGPISANSSYQTQMKDLENGTDTWAWTFSDLKSLITAQTSVLSRLRGENGTGQTQDH
jgi:CRISPR-associated autoregulator DevR family